jgi:hypothetical protein
MRSVKMRQLARRDGSKLDVDEEIDATFEQSKPDTEQPSPAYKFGRKRVSKADSDSGYSTGTSTSKDSTDVHKVHDSSRDSIRRRHSITDIHEDYDSSSNTVLGPPAFALEANPLYGEIPSMYIPAPGTTIVTKPHNMPHSPAWASNPRFRKRVSKADSDSGYSTGTSTSKDSTDIHKVHDSSRDSVRQSDSTNDIHEDYDSSGNAVVKPPSLTLALDPLNDGDPSESMQQQRFKLEHRRSTIRKRLEMMDKTLSKIDELQTKSSARKDWLPEVKDLPRAFMPTDDYGYKRRPSEETFCCTYCNHYPSGFLNKEELERHVNTAHKYQRDLTSLPNSERIPPELGYFTEKLRDSTDRRPDFSEDSEDNAWDSDSPKSLLRSRPRIRTNDTEEMIAETALRVSREVIKVSSFANRNLDNDAVDALWKEVRVRMHEQHWSLAKIDLYKDVIMRVIYEVIEVRGRAKKFAEWLSWVTKLASQSTSTGSQKGKKKVAEKDWVWFKPIVWRLYLEDNLTLRQIMVKLGSDYGIYPS